MHCQPRWIKQKTKQKYPLWCDDPSQCLQRGLFPVNLLCPGDIQQEIDQWIGQALKQPMPEDGMEVIQTYFETRQRVNDRIRDLRSTIANYNLPFLALPAQTDKSVALSVFINMNTNSKPLSQYDIIVAEVESVMGRSLHDLEADLHQKHPNVSRYAPLSSLILTVSALLQGHLPNQRGAWDMDKRVMVERWQELETCLGRMASFLESEKIFDEDRLPTNAVLAPIAALFSLTPTSGDAMGKCELIMKKYLWTAFFTDRRAGERWLRGADGKCQEREAKERF